MRYFRLYLHFIRFSFTKALQFRFDFTFRIFMDLVFHTLNLVFFRILFNHTTLIGDWNQSQVTLFVTSFILFDGIYMTVFATNAWWLPEHINKGELDYYLTKPVSPLFFFSFKEFAANSLMNLFFGIAIFSWALTQLEFSFHFFQLLLYILLIINGAFLYFAMQLLMYLPTFWTQSPRGFDMLLHGLDPILKYPISIQKYLMRTVFTFLLPLNIVLSYPAKIFFNEAPIKGVLIILVCTTLFWLFISWLWRSGIRQYSSASS